MVLADSSNVCWGDKLHHTKTSFPTSMPVTADLAKSTTVWHKFGVCGTCRAHHELPHRWGQVYQACSGLNNDTDAKNCAKRMMERDYKAQGMFSREHCTRKCKNLSGVESSQLVALNAATIDSPTLNKKLNIINFL